MTEPKVRVGFVIFNPRYEEELQNESRGHWWTAKHWVQKHNLEEEFKKVINDPNNGIYDYDDFLTDYIGAVKLHAVAGTMKCYVPRTVSNPRKSFLKRFYRNLGYLVYGDVSEDKKKEFLIDGIRITSFPYNQTVCCFRNGEYAYNPQREGD